MDVLLLVLILANLLINTSNSKFIYNKLRDIENMGNGPLKGIDDNDISFDDFKRRKNSQDIYLKDKKSGKNIKKRKEHQYYKGIPIYGASIVFEFDHNNDIEEKDPWAIYGKYYAPKYLSEHIDNTASNFNVLDLQTIVKNDLETALKQEISLPFDSFKCEEWIYNIGIPYYSFICMISSYKESIHYKYIIDANNGNILSKHDSRQYQAMQHDNSGNDKIGTSLIMEDTKSFDTLQDIHNRLYMVDCRFSHGSNCEDLQCTNEASPTNQQGCENDDDYGRNGGHGIAMLAYKYAIDTFECYEEFLNSPITSNLPVAIRVHHYEWNGISYGDTSAYIELEEDGVSFGNLTAHNVITLGVGDSDTYYPMVSIDVIAHELGHAFTNEYSGLDHGATQAGAINEAFSDLSGKACEWYSKGSFSNFTVGEDIRKDGRAVRYMDDPTRDGKSIDHFRDYTPGMDEHLASGIFNKAFYNMIRDHSILVDPFSPDVSASLEVIFKLVAHANKVYWLPTIAMNQAVHGIRMAAQDMAIMDDLDINWDDMLDIIRNAFTAVGVY